MKKFFIKILSIVLSLCFIFSLSISAYAEVETQTDIKEKIIVALQNSEYIKTEIGLADVDFNKLAISKPIHTYEYINDNFIENNIIYPLKINNELVALAISLDGFSCDYFQITTALVDEINLIIKDDMSFAIVYDYEHCYLYDGNEFYLLSYGNHRVENRSVLDVYNADRENIDISLTNIDSNLNLNYSVGTSPRTQTYFSCAVTRISQNPPSNMCWAASIACIVNYKKDTNYTAVQVAQKHYGNTNFDRGLPLGDQDNVLITDYFLLYRYKNEVPSDGVILKNINKDYPILATFKWSNGYHDVVIYGVNVIKGYISLMDPEFGFCSASLTSYGYRYVSGYSGVTLTLNRATCMYWSA